MCAERECWSRDTWKIPFVKEHRILDSPHNVNTENDRCMKHAHFDIKFCFKTFLGQEFWNGDNHVWNTIYCVPY